MILKTLASGLSPFTTKAHPVFNSGPKSLLKNPPDSPILSDRVFDNFIIPEELFTKALQSFKICVLVNLCGKLFLSLEPPTTSN